MVACMAIETCRFNSVKDLEVARFSWVNFVGLKYYHKCPYKTEGGMTHTEKKAM